MPARRHSGAVHGTGADERVVELEDAGAVAIAPERPAIAGGQLVAGDREQLARA